MGTIYLIESATSGKQYIGQTKLAPAKRFRAHIYKSRHDKKTKSFLYRAIRKYGESDFSLIELETNIETQAELNDAETFWIEWYQTEAPTGYNLILGPPGRFGKIQKKTIGRAAKGRRQSAETIAKQTIVARNRPPEYYDYCRKPCSPETRKKIGDANRGRKFSEEARRNMSLAHKGKPLSEAHKENIRISQIGLKKPRKSKRVA